MLNLQQTEQRQDNCPLEYQHRGCLKPYVSEYGIHPCGFCHICRGDNASQWTKRLTWEYLMHEKSCFLTLTYADNDIISLDYEHIQNFLKRLRKKINKYKGKEYPFKFFVAGEYGEKNTQRPHWHFIIFGLNADDLNDFISDSRKKHKAKYDCWKFGSVNDSQDITGIEGVAKYVSQYVLKKAGARTRDYEGEYGRKAPMNQCSKGLGLNYALENFSQQARFNFQINGTFNNLVWNGKKLFLPKYIRNKLGESLGILDKLKETGRENLKNKAESFVAIWDEYATEKADQEAIKYLKGENPKLMIREEHLANYYICKAKYNSSLAKFQQYKFKKQLEGKL